jgi:hypothetical protein
LGKWLVRADEKPLPKNLIKRQDIMLSQMKGILNSHVQVDRNLMLYLPRLAVLVTIEADRPGA